MFSNDINEMLASDEFDIDLTWIFANGKNCESVEVEFWIDVMLE